MAFDNPPNVNQWYKHLDKGYQFLVTAVDEDDDSIGIQHFDGDVEEIDLDAWYEMDIEPIEPPEDWTGPVDDAARDDLGYTETEMSDRDWDASLDEFEDPDEEPEE